MKSVKDFYNLKELPFSNTPDTKFFCMSQQYKEALAKLKYLTENRRGLGIIVGNIGMGKSTLARMFLDMLDEEIYEASMIIVVHSEVDSLWFLKKLAGQLGISNISNDKPEILSNVYRRLSELADEGKNVVVLIDESQMLRDKAIMEEIRGILNFEDERGKLITFILFGLPELENVLSLDEPLKQRVALRYLLKNLDYNDTKTYINHRIGIAGRDEPLFDSDALKTVFDYTKGIPRVINTLCDNAIFESYLMRKPIVTTDAVEQSARDLGLG